jgi:hypothetical protein
MVRNFEKGKGRRMKSISFNPGHDYLNMATQDYIEKGGKITKVENTRGDYEEFMNHYQSGSSGDFPASDESII